LYHDKRIEYNSLMS